MMCPHIKVKDVKVKAALTPDKFIFNKFRFLLAQSKQLGHAYLL